MDINIQDIQDNLGDIRDDLVTMLFAMDHICPECMGILTEVSKVSMIPKEDLVCNSCGFKTFKILLI